MERNARRADVGRMTKRDEFGSAGGAAVFAAALSALLVATTQESAPALLVGARYWIGITASVLLVRRALHLRFPWRGSEAAWTYGGIAVASASLRDIVRSWFGLFHHPDHPVVAGLGAIAGFCALAGFFCLSSSSAQAHQRTREVIETGLLTGAVVIVGWVAFLGDRVEASPLGLIQRTTSVLGAGILVCVASMCSIVLLRTVRGTRAVLVLYLVGMVSLLVGEVALGVHILGGGTGDGAGPLWTISLLVGFAAFAWGSFQPTAVTTARVHGGVMGARLSWIMWIVPSSGALVMAVPRLRPGIVDPVLLGIAGVLIAIHLIHQVAMVLENQRLVDGLDARVEARTAELAERERYFRSIFQHSADVIAVIGADWRIRDHTPSLRNVLGWDPDDLVGVRADDLLLGLGADQALNAYRDVFAGARSVNVFDRMPHTDGSWREVEIHVANQLDNPSIRGLVTTMRDITQRRALEGQLLHQSMHDALTGLPNRALFRTTVDRSMSIAASRGQSVTVVFLDLDGFKVVNDSFGHPAGDSLLVELARRLGRTVRVEDTLARLGGDEFALLLEPGIEVDATVRALTATLLEPFVIEGTEVRLSMSIGVAESAPAGSGATVDELLRNADIALFRSKHDRTRTAVRFEPAMLEAAAARLQMLTDLRRAVDDNEFVVWLQPIVDLSSAQVTGFEALVRWEHPTSGLIAPLDFIPLAEESGLIGEIGELVLRGAASAIVEEHQRHGTTFPVNVNVSARQFEDPDFSALVERVLSDTEMSSDALILEITESAVMRDPERARRQLQRLASIGVKVALDDFGTGHSSLAALSRFPLDILKVDRSFITALQGDRDAALAVLTAIEEVGRALGLKIVAEGVETTDERDNLIDLGYRYGQGYLFGRPSPAADALSAVRARSAGGPSEAAPLAPA